MKKLLIKRLQNRAKKYILRYKPTVIGVTGSIGKTSTKQAIATALHGQVSLRVSDKNYNNEIGLPISIFGVEAPGRSISAWLKLLFGSLPDAPDVIVLEYGIDHPHDMDRLCEIVQPDIAVVTGISPVHAEFFANVDDLTNEKAKLVEYAKKDGFVVLNADDDRVAHMRGKSRSPIVTYGSSGDIRLEEITVDFKEDNHFSPNERVVQTKAKVNVQGESYDLQLENHLGIAPVMSSLAALAIVAKMQLNVSEAVQSLETMLPHVPGRLNVLAGIKGSLVIDDSYNAAPAAMQNGLEILRQIPLYREQNRRIAALGSMAELGQYTENEHRLVGLKVAEVADVFIAVGENMRIAIDAAKEAGMNPEHIEWFKDSTEAGRYLDRSIQEGDIVYVKGSQSTRMERVVKDIMAEPQRAKELLVRQSEKWLNT